MIKWLSFLQFAAFHPSRLETGIFVASLNLKLWTLPPSCEWLMILIGANERVNMTYINQLISILFIDTTNSNIGEFGVFYKY